MTLYRERRYVTPPKGTLAHDVHNVREAMIALLREIVRVTRVDVAMLALAKWLERRR